MAPRQKTFTPDLIDDIYAHLYRLEEKIRLLNKTPTHVERINPRTLPDPVESQVAIDSRTNCFIYYSAGFWRSKCSAVKACKVFGDRTTNKILDGAFRLTIADDLADCEISDVQAFNGTPGTGATTIQLVNKVRVLNVLSTPMTIPDGAYDSNNTEVIDEGGNPNDPNNVVHLRDRIWINTTAIGAGSKGLGVYITFHGPKVDLSF